MAKKVIQLPTPRKFSHMCLFRPTCLAVRKSGLQKNKLPLKEVKDVVLI